MNVEFTRSVPREPFTTPDDLRELREERARREQLRTVRYRIRLALELLAAGNVDRAIDELSDLDLLLENEAT
jgi:hypothetical protein